LLTKVVNAPLYVCDIDSVAVVVHEMPNDDSPPPSLKSLDQRTSVFRAAGVPNSILKKALNLQDVARTVE
jgi:hypothetical protein